MNTFLFMLLCAIISAALGAGSAFVYEDVATSLADGYPPNPNSPLAIIGIPIILVGAPNFIAAELLKLGTWKDALITFREPVQTTLIVFYFLFYVAIFGYGALSINKASCADRKSNKKSSKKSHGKS